MLALFGTFGTWEAVLILVAILLLFGGRKLPELARGLGKGLREFKKSVRGLHDDVEDAIDDGPEPAEPNPESQAGPTSQREDSSQSESQTKT